MNNQLIKELEADLNELKIQPSANAEVIKRIEKKIRAKFINALVRLSCDKNWLNQFKTEDLKNMYNELSSRDMETLTEEIVLKAIEPFKHEWIADTDWWIGSITTYKNAIYGYDINIVHDEETKKIEAIIYALVQSRVDNGFLEISKDTLFKFEIKIEPTSWEQGEILTPIAIEDGAPFELSQNYLITEVKEEKREKRTAKIYTLNDRCDFRYSDFEISAYFKKAVLS